MKVEVRKLSPEDEQEQPVIGWKIPEDRMELKDEFNTEIEPERKNHRRTLSDSQAMSFAGGAQPRLARTGLIRSGGLMNWARNLSGLFPTNDWRVDVEITVRNRREIYKKPLN